MIRKSLRNTIATKSLNLFCGIRKHGFGNLITIPSIEYGNIVYNKSDYWELMNDKQLPVIIRGLAKFWPAIHNERRKWSLDYLKQRVGDQIVTVEAYGDYMNKDMKQLLINFDGYIDFLKSGIDGHFYLAQRELEEFPMLKDDIVKPQLCNTGKSTLYRSNIWLGPSGIASPCHYDPFQNILCQVIGSKRVILFHPSQTSNLYPAIGTTQKNTSMIDMTVSCIDYQKYPLFEKCEGYEGEIHRGDGVFIPYKYWHFCQSTSISCSINFWWL
mmetsp:Transcript_19848/g.19955  ORF Transcript_19848/g.19955 Transcript_19848/m.19955 type:complete len:271 (+) Transcript_19848:85-897(+)